MPRIRRFVRRHSSTTVRRRFAGGGSSWYQCPARGSERDSGRGREALAQSDSRVGSGGYAVRDCELPMKRPCRSARRSSTVSPPQTPYCSSESIA